MNSCVKLTHKYVTLSSPACLDIYFVRHGTYFGRIVANDVTILFNMEWQAEVRERLTLYFGTIFYY